jgi:hypothetical protein
MKEINLSIYGIKVSLDADGSGTIISTDLRVEVGRNLVADELYNSAMDGIESLILACACAGIDIEDERFIEAITTSVEAVANNL